MVMKRNGPLYCTVAYLRQQRLPASGACAFAPGRAWTGPFLGGFTLPFAAVQTLSMFKVQTYQLHLWNGR